MRSQRHTRAPGSGLLRSLVRFCTALVLITGLTSPIVDAQVFDSGSDGSDGALSFPGAQPGDTVVFDPASFVPPLDPDGDNVYHFTTVTIPAGVTVRLSADLLGVAPVVWLASGAVLVEGTLDLNGAEGHLFGAAPLPSVAGAGGYGGGIGATPTNAAQPGNGPGRGLPTADSAGGGAGHTVTGTHAEGTIDTGGPAYGNAFLVPILGGSGGAGSFSRTGGGAGGGALLIASSTSILVNGTIQANGGFGIPTNTAQGGTGAGGGSGGAIRLMAPVISGTGTLSATGGPVGNSSLADGGLGSHGRIRLEAFQTSFTGSADPAPSAASPGLVFPPASAPSVRVVSVDGVAVPANPTGSFLVVDVTLDDVSTATLDIEAQNVPVGTVVQITLTPETGPAVTVSSTPLVGTEALSTATAQVTIPHGFSRFRVEATWTP